MGSSPRVTSTYRPSLDIVGAMASVVCAVHCAGVALLLGIVPALQMVAPPWVDWFFLSASTMVGLMALIPGFRQHRHPMPLVMFVGGITALAITRAMRLPPSVFELTVVLVAASALITAHWRNRGELRSCRCAPAPVAGAVSAASALG